MRNLGRGLLESALAPCALLAFGLALRALYFVGYANVDPWDDTIYLELAEHHRKGELDSEFERASRLLEQGDLTAPDAFVSRRGAYVPISWAQSLLGSGERSAALPSLLASLGTILLTFHLATHLLGRAAALWSAFFYCLVPLDVTFATRILADAPQTFWITASIAAAFVASQGARSRGTRVSLYVASAACLYLATLTRLNGLIGLPLAALAAASAFGRRETRLEPLVLPAALGVLLAIDCGYSWLRWGNAGLLYELEIEGARKMFVHNPEAVFRPFSWLAIHSSYLEGVPHHFFKLFLGIVDHYGGVKLFSLLAPLGVLALGYALAIRKHLLLVAWTVIPFLYVQYGCRALEWDGESGTLHYFLNAHRPRYLMILLPALCMLGGLLAERLRRSAGPAWTLFLLGALSAVVMSDVRRAHRFYRGSMQDVREAASFLASAEPSPVFSDEWGVRQLPWYTGGRKLDLRRLTSQAPPSGSWVVVGGSRGFDIPIESVRATLPSRWQKLPQDPSLAPRSWRVIARVQTTGGPEPTSPLVIFRTEGREE